MKHTHARLIIPVTVEQRKKLFQAEALLREVGLRFDTGYGFGERIWELDWSLHGATLQVNQCDCKERDVH